MPARLLVEEAEGLFAELLASQDEVTLLHGDLYHHNVLSARREPWLAIDPEGVVGEPACDAAALLHNPVLVLAIPRPGELLKRRIGLLSKGSASTVNGCAGGGSPRRCWPRTGVSRTADGCGMRRCASPSCSPSWGDSAKDIFKESRYVLVEA